MKKFKFSLENVLKFKEQVEDSIRTEHAQILQRIVAQEKRLTELEEEYDSYVLKFEVEKSNGCKVQILMMYESYLASLQSKIDRQVLVIKQLRQREEQKREELIQAKVEKSSINIIKDKRKAEYRQLEQKAEELMIEEFVSNARSGKKRC